MINRYQLPDKRASSPVCACALPTAHVVRCVRRLLVVCRLSMSMCLASSSQASTCVVSGRKQASSRRPHNRVDRAGTLLAFQPPFRPATPVMYSATATKRCALLSITREALGEVLAAHPSDASVIRKAMEHAAKVFP